MFCGEKLNLDHSLCMLVYENIMFLNAHNEYCHGSMVGRFRYALGVDILENMKHKIAQMHVFGLSHVQIMQQHTKKTRDLALVNGIVTCNMFLLPLDVRNICQKRTEEIWMKDTSGPIIVCMWTLEHPDSVFFYQEHSLVDFNYST